MEGVILEAESGDYLGKHRGFWFYTIGQRQGLRLPGGPWYVQSRCLTRSLFAAMLSANCVTYHV
jgi:tRNA U34 2-thiouridine synthase MnmA/TrmU